MSVIDDRGFAVRAAWALVCAHARYWTRVAPLVRRQIRVWETRAGQIVDPLLRGLALGKLADERFNIEVAAIIATIAPARDRRRTVEAIVALQVMYDYLDALTEQPAPQRIRDGLQYTKAFTDAVTTSAHPVTDYYDFHDGNHDDEGYLADLALTVRSAVGSLPAAAVVPEDILVSAAARCGEAQVRIHAAPQVGMTQLERWAAQEASGTGLHWREWLFGAMGSVVAVHALIALAADPRSTVQEARELDDTYLWLCVLTTALDHLVDQERDIQTGEQSYLRLYETREELTRELATVIRGVTARTRRIRNGAHHLMVLSGVVAYYTSQPAAMEEYARPVTEHVRDELRPLITPTLASMHAWRWAKRLRSRCRRV
jgi:tetraprenyl-beta-curcumene synthase